MSFYYGDENNPEVNLAKQVFETFAGTSGGLSQQQFRRIFHATGEDLPDNDINELFNEVDDDRDGTISLEEFTKWFRRDDSYEYNIRTKPLRDVKERLKTPAFFRAVQYLMQRNSGGSGLDSSKKILDVNLKLKVGNMEHQQPSFGFDIRHETHPNDYANPALVFEFIWDESREIIDAENNMREVAKNWTENHHNNAVFEPLQVDGRPGGRMTIDLANEAREPLQMITSFMSNLEEFHFWVHLSQGLDDLNGSDLMADLGLVFKGNRAFFNMLPLEMAMGMGFKPEMYQMAQLLDHVHLNVAVDRLGELGQNILPPQPVVQRIKGDFSREINYGVMSADFIPLLPMGVKTLKTFKIKAFGHSFVATGINVDVSFIFNQAYNNEEQLQYFNRYKPVHTYEGPGAYGHADLGVLDDIVPEPNFDHNYPTEE